MLFRKEKKTVLAGLALAAKSRATRAALAVVGSLLLLRAISNRKYRAKKFFSRLAGR